MKLILLTLSVIALMAAGCSQNNPTNMTSSDSSIPAPKISESDKTMFLSKIVAYIKDNKIDTNPAKPDEYNISSIEEGTYQEKDVWVVYLDCCFLGDLAYIDKQTGQVLGFVTGAK